MLACKRAADLGAAPRKPTQYHLADPERAMRGQGSGLRTGYSAPVPPLRRQRERAGERAVAIATKSHRGQFIGVRSILVVKADLKVYGRKLTCIDLTPVPDAFLRKRGLIVLRSWNNEVLNDMQAVLDRIWATALLPPPSPRPSPAGAGEGDSSRAHTADL